MFWYLHLAVTKALWVDQWTMLEEIWRFLDGRFGIGYLWAPYWGQRILIPRLVFLIDYRFFHFSNGPLVAVNIVCQCGAAIVLMALEWRALRERSHMLAFTSIAVTAHLTLSALQMENFVYGMSVQYEIGYGAAVAALALPGLLRRRWIVFVCALISTLSIAVGVLVWPVLALELWWLKARRLAVASVAATGLGIAVVYSIAYQRPEMGMGLAGMARRPFHAIFIAAMYLGGPLSLASVKAGAAVGIFGLALAGLWAWRAAKKSPERAALIAICVFLGLSAFAIAGGRISPEFLASFHGAPPLPSRYFTPPYFFWACLLAVAFGSRSRVAALLTGLVAAGLTLGTIRWEWQAGPNWFAHTRLMDAAASGFFVGAWDPEYMSPMVPDQRLLDHWTPYLREHQLSVFAEPRATWTGKRISDLPAAFAPCQGEIGELFPTGGDTRRARGTIPRNGKLDIAFVDSSGIVAGTGRTIGDGRFLGYVRDLRGGRLSLVCGGS